MWPSSELWLWFSWNSSGFTERGPGPGPDPDHDPLCTLWETPERELWPGKPKRQRHTTEGLIPDQLLPSVSMRGVQQQVCDLRVGRAEDSDGRKTSEEEEEKQEFRVKDQKGLLTGKGKQNQNQVSSEAADSTPQWDVLRLSAVSPLCTEDILSPTISRFYPVKPSALSSGRLSCPVPPSSKGGDKKPRSCEQLEPAAAGPPRPLPRAPRTEHLKPPPHQQPTPPSTSHRCEMVGTDQKGASASCPAAASCPTTGTSSTKVHQPPRARHRLPTNWSASGEGIWRGPRRTPRLGKRTLQQWSTEKISRFCFRMSLCVSMSDTAAAEWKVVIVHAIHNDFKDTSRIPLLNLKAGFAERSAPRSRLTKAIFNRDIQTGKRSLFGGGRSGLDGALQGGGGGVGEEAPQRSEGQLVPRPPTQRENKQSLNKRVVWQVSGVNCQTPADLDPDLDLDQSIQRPG
ncbi:hypothetical protein INR49_023232 [Caranx melampygus]|nr:hypothetical protein INR49_023232 [Caranx melampygus]